MLGFLCFQLINNFSIPFLPSSLIFATNAHLFSLLCSSLFILSYQIDPLIFILFFTLYLLPCRFCSHLSKYISVLSPPIDLTVDLIFIIVFQIFDLVCLIAFRFVYLLSSIPYRIFSPVCHRIVTLDGYSFPRFFDLSTNLFDPAACSKAFQSYSQLPPLSETVAAGPIPSEFGPDRQQSYHRQVVEAGSHNPPPLLLSPDRNLSTP